MDVAWNIFGVEVELLQQRRQEFGGVEFVEIFPVEIAAVDDPAAADVEQVDGDLRRLGVPAEHVGIVAGSGGDFLPFLHFGDGAQQVAVGGGLFELFVFRRGVHADLEAVGQVAAPAFEEHAHIVRGFRVAFVSDQAGDAGAEAAVNVVLQAGARMRAGQVHGAGRDQKMFVDQVNHLIRQARWEIGAEIHRAVFGQAAGDVDPREFLEGGVADVRVGFVVAQEDIEFRFILLDEIVF